MKIAAAAYPLDPVKSWDAYAEKITRWVAEAADDAADLLVFPEYGAMELAMLEGAKAAADPLRCAEAVAARMEMAHEVHADLAARYRMHILAGSGPARDGARFVNRAGFFAPDQGPAYQDKLTPTPWERNDWCLAPGGPLQLFDTALGRIGVLICYDAEFPLLARALIEAGAEILLIPSNTEARSGFHRVRIAAMARALEGQCITVQSPVVGPAPWCPEFAENTGAAGIFGPPDTGFPDDGVIAIGALNTPGWVYAEIDLAALARVRRDGAVRTVADWGRHAAPHPSVNVVPLTR